MTALTTSVVTNSSGDAGFRVWGSSYAPLLTTCGWVKTSDTGQINWTSVSRPGTTTTSAGYEMFRMNDSLQASYPVYLKIEYGTGASTSLTALWITVGFATDGAGTINSTNYSTRRYLTNTTSGSATPYNWYSCGTTSRFVNVEYCTSPAYRRIFAVERMHTYDGSDVGTGVMLWMNDGASIYSNYAQLVPTSGTVPTIGAYSNISGTTSGLNTTGISQIVGTDCYISPVRLFGRGEGYPMHSIFAYFNTDLSALSSASVTIWDGSSATILPVDHTLSANMISNMKIAIRFD